jgi:hypothetical protein
VSLRRSIGCFFIHGEGAADVREAKCAALERHRSNGREPRRSGSVILAPLVERGRVGRRGWWRKRRGEGREERAKSRLFPRLHPAHSVSPLSLPSPACRLYSAFLPPPPIPLSTLYRPLRLSTP